MARFRCNTFLVVALACASSAASAADPASATPAPEDGTADATLTRTITALDKQLFDAYNACDLDTFTPLFSPTVEFFHDKGGATFDRDSVIKATRENICHKVRRELLPATLKIYPIHDYGAIEEGEHIFCQVATGQCEGSARFLMIWKRDGERWQLTRIVSYGHRALTDQEKAELAPHKPVAAR
jgi:hypothetical protein